MKPLALTWLFRFVLALFVGKGLSSHYRGGTVSYRPNGNSPYSVDFSFRLSFRRGAVFCDNSSVTNKRLATTSFSNSWRVTRYGWYGSYNSGSTAAKIYCSDFNVKEDWSEGYNNFTYSGGSGDAYWIVKITDGGDWIHNIIYSNPSDDMLLNAKVNRTDGVFNNSSPVSSIPLTVYVVKGIPSVVRIPVEDPDGDIVRCRNATYLECYRAMCTYFPYGVLDERNCTLSYNGNGSLGLYPIILKLEDFPHETTQFDSSNSLGSVDLQFIVHVKDNLTGLVRIQGGGSSGRLQVYYNGVWGTVCDDGWTMTNTHVVCRQLGFRGAISYHNNGGGSGQIWLDDVRCSGSESSIEQCRHNGWGRHNCGHSEDVFVTCSPKVQVRLVNGTTPNEGRVEVYYNGRWGTICDDDWGISDANVVCRQLGLPPASFAPCCAQFGQGTGPILMDDVGCNGGESSVTLCRFRGWGSHNCAHSEDAGVVCGNISRPTTASLVATTSPQGFNDSCQSFPCLNGGTCYYNWYSGHRCTCPYGYSGRQCEINMIPCNSNPCRNRGTCQSGYGWYRCTCPFGYTGRQCETRFNDSCPSFPCLNGGTCYYNGYYGYRCNCPYGYSGRQCETNMNPCNSSPCRNKGTCQSGYGWYRCTCPYGYTGRQCETRFNDSCPSFPCLNGGTCYYNGYYGYRCNCPYGYSGRQCETNMNPCNSNPCRNRGTCQSGYGWYRCTCPLGYTGRQCETGFNDSCPSFPCLNGGTCYYNGYYGYRCNCPYGYSGRQCETNMNPCNSNPCRNRGTCQSGYGWYRCTCPFGYTGRQCETRFNDSCPSFPCLNGGTCYYNWYSGYRCNCPSGYSGRQCETNMNQCVSRPCRNGGTCRNGYYGNGYYCSCLYGYTGRQCESNLRTRVTCGENYMQIELKSQYFSDIDWRNLHLRNTSCRATRTLYTMTLRTPLDGCGTTYTEQDKKLVLWNEVRNENLLSAVGNLSSITRGGNIILPFFCEYGREKLVSTSFSASKKRVFASEGSYGNFTFTMDLYQTSQYRTPYSPFAYPVVVYPNQPLWVQYQVKNTNADLVVFAKKCHATPSNDPNAFPQHVFLEKGCIRDPTMVYWYNPYSQVQRFSIRSFRFVYSNTFLVYLHCQLIVCHRNSTNSRCARGCISPRRRREAIDMDGSKEYDLSAGPLKGPYTKTGSDKQGGDESSLSTSATVGVVSAVAVVALLVATILAVKMLRNRSRLHDHVATPAPPIAMNVTVNSYEQQVMENDDRMEIEI